MEPEIFTIVRANIFFKNRKYFSYFALRASCLSLGQTQASEDILPPASDLTHDPGLTEDTPEAAAEAGEGEVGR